MIHSDTKIRLLDNRILTLPEIYKEIQEGQELFIYSSSETGEITISKIISCSEIEINRKNQLVKITLDSDEELLVSEKNSILTRLGEIKLAKDLKEDESLMPLYIEKAKDVIESKGKYNRGEYFVVRNNKDKTWKFIHYLSDEYNQERGLDILIKDKSTPFVRHHKDFNKYNNNPDNIQRMTPQDHRKMHGDVGRRNVWELWNLPGKDEQRLSVMLNSSKIMKANWEKPGYREKMKELGDERNKSPKNPFNTKEHQAKMSAECKTPERRKISSEIGKTYGTDNILNYARSDENRERASNFLSDLNKNTAFVKFYKILQDFDGDIYQYQIYRNTKPQAYASIEFILKTYFNNNNFEFNEFLKGDKEIELNGRTYKNNFKGSSFKDYEIIKKELMPIGFRNKYMGFLTFYKKLRELNWNLDAYREEKVRNPKIGKVETILEKYFNGNESLFNEFIKGTYIIEIDGKKYQTHIEIEKPETCGDIICNTNFKTMNKFTDFVKFFAQLRNSNWSLDSYLQLRKENPCGTAKIETIILKYFNNDKVKFDKFIAGKSEITLGDIVYHNHKIKKIEYIENEEKDSEFYKLELEEGFTTIGLNSGVFIVNNSE